MSDERQNIENAVKGVFRKIEELPVPADPFLESRVLARFRERQQRTPFLWWKRLAIGSTAFSALAVLLLVVSLVRASSFDAIVNQPFVVRIELKQLNQSQIAKAEIALPPGVYFDIESFPELKDQKTLSLRWNSDMERDYFPFVLNSTECGTKRITVRFLNAHNELIAERSLNVRLKKQSET